MSSSLFGSLSPRRPHLAKVGQGGLAGELADLRADVETAFQAFDDDPQLGVGLRRTTTVLPQGNSGDAARLQAALTAMAAVGGKVIVGAGSLTLTDNVTGTSGVAVDIMPGASIVVSAAKTLTLAGACNILGATNPFSGAGAVSLAVPSSGAVSRRLTWSLATGGDTLYLTSTTDAEVLAVDAKAGTTVDIQTWRVGGTVVGDITATGAIEIKAISFQHDLTGPDMGGGNGVIAEAFGGSLSIASGNQSNGNIVLTAYDGGAVHGALYFQAGAGADTKLILDGTHGYFKNNYRFGWNTTSGGAGGGAVQDIFWLSAADEVIIGGGLSTTGGKLMTAGAGATCLQWGVSGTNMGFLGAAPVARQTVTGGRGGIGAVTSALTALANFGLITNSSTTGVTALTYSATIATDAALGHIFTIVATNGTAYTISSPTNPTTGQEVTYDIKNSSGGAMGAITWGAAFLLAGAFTNPASTKRRTIRFYYDGTNWIEICRAAADI